MLLNEQELKKIIFREPKKLKHKHNNTVLFSYEYDEWERLSVIQTFIHERTNKDVGALSAPQGNLCPSFIQLAINKGINPMLAMNKGHDFNAAEFAFEQCLKFYKNKYNEIRN